MSGRARERRTLQRHSRSVTEPAIYHLQVHNTEAWIRSTTVKCQVTFIDENGKETQFTRFEDNKEYIDFFYAS